jgi:hypothetical protein
VRGIACFVVRAHVYGVYSVVGDDGRFLTVTQGIFFPLYSLPSDGNVILIMFVAEHAVLRGHY